MSILRCAALSTLALLVACRADSVIAVTDYVSVTVSAGGIKNGESIPGSDCINGFDDAGGGGTFSLVAREDDDSEFVGWSGCVSTNGRECTLSFERRTNPSFIVTATFRKRGGAGVIGFDVNLLQNASFEELVAVGSLPNVVGYWQGDDANSVIPPTGISVPQGLRVLQFLTTGPSVASETGVSSQLWQLVDVASLAADIDAGKVRATAKARFASVPGDAQTDRRFDLRVGAFTGRPTDFPAAYLAPAGLRLADPTVSVITANTGAWLPAELTFILPPGTRYLAVEIYAFENVFNDAIAPEFDGHFADETSLFLRRVP
jgi:hypothetical protein